MTKYLMAYNNLIATRRPLTRSKKTGSYEIHHIVPKSLGGLNTKNNLVLLTPREHFLAHKLLYKHYNLEGTINQKYSMALAFNRLSKLKAADGSIKKVTSRLYEELKLVINQKMTGEGNPMYGVPSTRKGTKITDPKVIENVKLAGVRSRKLIGTFDWKNKYTNEIVLNTTIHTLAETYGLSIRKLACILNTKGKEADRKSHKGWHLLEVDPINKKQNTKNETTATTWYNLDNQDLTIYGTVLDICKMDPSVNYRTLLVTFNHNLRLKESSHKGWTTEYTFNLKKDRYNFLNNKKFTFTHTQTKIEYTGTLNDFTAAYNLRKNKVVELADKQLQSHKGWTINE